MPFTDPATCLALAIYWEARNQPTSGQVAVAQTILNRVSDKKFPNNICAVVTQGPRRNGMPIKHRCQFSFYCDGKPDRPENLLAYDKAKYLAFATMSLKIVDISDGALYYHSVDVSPDWASKKRKVARITDHVFYK